MPPKKGTEQAAKGKKAPKEFNAKNYAREGATEDDIKTLKDCYDIFDTDKSGELDLEELRNAIVALGLEKTADRLMGLLTDLDTNKDNTISFEEFLAILGCYKRDFHDDRYVEELFDKFDTNGKKNLGFEDFKRIANQIGERYTDDELKDMVQYADNDGDNLVNFEEFKAVLQKENP